MVPGQPKTRFPDLTVLDEAHLTLLARRRTITREIPPPRLVVEGVSPGNEKSENYKRNYEEKSLQYAAIGVPEYWIIDPDRAWIKVGTLINGEYQFETFREDAALVSLVFPDLTLTVTQIFQGGAILVKNTLAQSANVILASVTPTPNFGLPIAPNPLTFSTMVP